jgi:hypothetical protein
MNITNFISGEFNNYSWYGDNTIESVYWVVNFGVNIWALDDAITFEKATGNDANLVGAALRSTIAILELIYMPVLAVGYQIANV